MSDLIDRDKAIEAIGEIHSLDYNAQAIKARIEQLPSAQPERKKGKWKKWWEIKQDGFGGEEYIPHWACADCGTEYSPHLTSAVHYCVHCGAEMEVEK